MDTDNTYKKFGEIWTRNFWDVQADRQTPRKRDSQTEKQTNTLMTILCPPIRGEVINPITSKAADRQTDKQEKQTRR